MSQEENNDLLNFNWEDSAEDTFFKPTEEVKVTKVKEEEEKEDKNPKVEKPKEEEEDENYFSEEEEIDEDNIPTNTEGSYNDFYKDLKEQGIFKHVEIDENEIIDADKLYELQEEEYEAEVSQRLTDWATKDLDEDAKAFIKFKREGGKTQEFFKAYSRESVIPEGNIEDEAHQDNVIRYQLAQEGWDKEEIEDRLEYLTESNKKEKVAQKYNEKLKQEITKSKQELIEQQEEIRKNSKAQEDLFKNTVKDTLSEVEDIKGFKITPKDKTTIFNFLTKKDVKVSEGKSITGFQKKLSETFQDSEKMILLAKLIESDFDFTSFEKATKTKQTREIKNNLEQRTNLRSGGSGSSSQRKNLADLFN